MSQTGLYGISGLGGNNTNNWLIDVDYGKMDVAPPTDRSDLAKTRSQWKTTAAKRRPLPYMHPEIVKQLVSVLSTPEILQVSWKSFPY